jgi:ribulose-phosphate 3-epimerase
MALCSVSLWSANLAELASEITKMNPYADYFHIDVGDGYATPELLFFPDLLRALKPYSMRPFEVHVMAEKPQLIINSFLEGTADVIDIHPEAFSNPFKQLEMIKDHDIEAGIVVSLDSNLDFTKTLLKSGLVDICVCLGQRIGHKGSDPDSKVYQNLRHLRRFIDSEGLDVLLQADGGIRAHTAELLVEAGADILVPGSLAFATDYTQTLPWLQSLKY